MGRIYCAIILIGGPAGNRSDRVSLPCRQGQLDFETGWTSRSEPSFTSTSRHYAPITHSLWCYGFGTANLSLCFVLCVFLVVSIPALLCPHFLA
ncbi:hypothetical protein BDV06DRAFT_91224 [Aspergillus oleicola]